MLTTTLAGASVAGGSFAVAQDATSPAPLDAPRIEIDPAPASLDDLELTPPVETSNENADDEVLFEANSVHRDDDNSPIVAEGNVRAFFGERYLKADKLTYNPETDIVIAEGNVSITDENLETVFAGRVELSGDLRDGLAENFSALLADNARLAAESAVQEQGARTHLNRAVYTACNVCNDDGDAKTPTWRIKSLRITRDLERRVVRFHHAFLEIKGVPILYVPFLQAPDPSVERQSGFLPPQIGASSRLGFNYEQPYYFAISNSQDATFFPRYTATDGTLWQGEWRRRGNNGYHVVSGGIIDDDGPIEEDEEDIPGVRWGVFARGYQNVSDRWRASYDIERVSDDDYIRQYDIERRGDLRQALDRGRTNQLRSNARLAYEDANNSLSFDSYLFQSLRPIDEQSTTPFVLPLINYEHRFPQKIKGGRASFNANIASLQRTEGIDSRRLTARANWERDVITKGGHKFNIFAEARGDVFYFDDLDQGTEVCTSATAACANDFAGFSTEDTDDVVTRFAPTIGAEWSYPLVKDVGRTRLFLEPRVQLVAGLANRNPNSIINEDSQSTEFDYASLFESNKVTGFDAVEDGQRANIGLALSAQFPNRFTIDGSIGQQYRLQTSDAFDFSTGLGEESSDIVGSLNIKYGQLVGLENRFRFEEGFSGIGRVESMAYLNANRFSTRVGYILLNEEDPINGIEQREELLIQARANITDHWSVGGAWRLDLESELIDGVIVPDQTSVTTIRQDFTVGYEDECSTFQVTFRRDRTRTTSVEPDNAVIVRFTLKSLVNSP